MRVPPSWPRTVPLLWVSVGILASLAGCLGLGGGPGESLPEGVPLVEASPTDGGRDTVTVVGTLEDRERTQYPYTLLIACTGAQVPGATPDPRFGKVVEVDLDGNVIWSAQVQGGCPSHARRMRDGRTILGNIWYGDGHYKTLIIDPQGSVLWRLDLGPHVIVPLENGNYLVSETRMNSVFELTPEKRIVWDISTPERTDPDAGIVSCFRGGEPVRDPGFPYGPERRPRSLLMPYGATQIRKADGSLSVLVADSFNLRVAEFHKGTKKLIWQFGRPGLHGLTDDGEEDWQISASKVLFPRAAQRLRNGHTVVSDYGRGCAVEVDRSGQIVWRGGGCAPPGTFKFPGEIWRSYIPDPRPPEWREPVGELTFIADTGNHAVLVYDTTGIRIWSYGDVRKTPSPVGIQIVPKDPRKIRYELEER